jgi:hypothetical protein
MVEAKGEVRGDLKNDLRHLHLSPAAGRVTAPVT